MDCFLTNLFAASALGVGNEATFVNYRRRVAPGMTELVGDIPSRSIRFGLVPGELPAIAEPQWSMRTCRLVKLAAEGFGGALERLVARYGASRVGIVLGASNTGIDEAQRFVTDWLDAGVRPPAFDFSMIELGTPSRYLKEILGVRGPAYTVSTACSSATKAFGSAMRLMEGNVCDAVVVGGVDGRCRFAMNGFHALGALSAGVCRPLAPDRDGITLGEAVALFTLERAPSETGPVVRLRGVGESSDAHHATAPDPEGRGAEAAMRTALAAAGLEPGGIDYVNLHGTGTVANDDMEMKAFRRVFGDATAYESTKDLTGHCLGAAGAIEAAICWLRIASGEIRTALSNSFAFGGSNASVVLSA